MVCHHNVCDIVCPALLHMAADAVDAAGVLRHAIDRGMARATCLDRPLCRGPVMRVVASGAGEFSGTLLETGGSAKPVSLRGDLELIVPSSTWGVVEVNRIRAQPLARPE